MKVVGKKRYGSQQSLTERSIAAAKWGDLATFYMGRRSWCNSQADLSADIQLEQDPLPDSISAALRYLSMCVDDVPIDLLKDLEIALWGIFFVVFGTSS